ncbi:MAG TPA: hypothetical protein VNT23_05360 [Gaiellaceae bacterium]|nr:hypothetical protein [Gaiellaceae bacterium]
MWRSLLVVAGAAALVGTALAAAPARVETRAQALLELQAAIADEERALALIRKDPPRRDTARLALGSARDRLAAVRDFLSTAPGAQQAEATVERARVGDARARDAVGRYEEKNAILLIGEALAAKRAALPLVRKLPPPSAAVPQCSDGKDNDGDGLVDARDEPGCTGARDVRESTPFTCALSTDVVAGRLAVTGSCSGAFAAFDVTLLDSQLNGRFDVKHAPSCGAPRPTSFRCTAKDGLQNPRHLVDIRLTTTSVERAQRVRLRFFDRKQRRIANLVLPQR